MAGAYYFFLFGTTTVWSSPIRTWAEVDRSIVITPVRPIPPHSIFQCEVAVIVYFPCFW